jgi:tetratricopeptide (TPR) repeat protein
MTRLQTAVAAFLVCVLTSIEAPAQVIRVAGTVKDDSGRPVRGAAITAENPDNTPPRLTATSNDRGEFGFIGLRRGAWTISVEAPGFEPARLSRTVAAGRQQTMDVRLTRTAVPAALPLDGIKASDIQQQIERAESLMAGGDLDAAIAAWRGILSRVPALTSVHLQLAALYERKSDPDRAIAEYQQLLKNEPENPKALAGVRRLGGVITRD